MLAMKGLGLLLLVTGSVPTTQPGNVPEIPDVTSMAELRKAKAFDLPSGWRVRLGLADAGPDAGPWKLLYCLARYRGEGKPTYHVERVATVQPFGPVSFTLDPVDEERAWQAGRGKPVPVQMAKKEEFVFCGQVLTAWKGKYRLRAWGSNGALLAQTRITVDEPTPCYWQQFAQGGRELVPEGGGTAYVVRPKPIAAIPTCLGNRPIWPPTGRQVQLSYVSDRHLPEQIEPLLKTDAPLLKEALRPEEGCTALPLLSNRIEFAYKAPAPQAGVKKDIQAKALRIAADHIRQHRKEWADKLRLPSVVTETADAWKVTFTLPEGTLGGVPVIIIDKKALSVKSAYHTQ